MQCLRGKLRCLDNLVNLIVPILAGLPKKEGQVVTIVQIASNGSVGRPLHAQTKSRPRAVERLYSNSKEGWGSAIAQNEKRINRNGDGINPDTTLLPRPPTRVT